ARLDLLAGDRPEVVGDLERAETLLTGVVRAELAGGAALAALQRRGVAEGAFSQDGTVGQGDAHDDSFISPGRRSTADGLSTWPHGSAGCWGFVGPCPSAPRDELASA